MWCSSFLIILGFILLAYGGNCVCSGASALAFRLGVSQLVIGMTIVAISTSSPEFITSLMAALNQHPEIVIGNIVGSNLVNIGLAGGFVALVKPFTITTRITEQELPFLLLVTCIFSLCSIVMDFGSILGMAFIVLDISYMYFICKNEEDPQTNRSKKALSVPLKINFWKALGLFFLGIFLLFLGARLVINHSVKIAHVLGWSDTLIGFTIVAIGTSSPEIMVSLVAALRGYGAICTGNIIGSNIFNTLMIVGVCALVCPLPVNGYLCYCTIPLLIFLTALMWLFFTTKREINRLEGLMLFGGFILIFSISVYMQMIA
ncbi:MAG: calcium/sodium antiporter [Puniceicoccales bacterium]|jgi:cation:H+ antiporter|nr:calcium/sodium antiporter [Puniceicoccales bacterium]